MIRPANDGLFACYLLLPAPVRSLPIPSTVLSIDYYHHRYLYRYDNRCLLRLHGSQPHCIIRSYAPTSHYLRSLFYRMSFHTHREYRSHLYPMLGLHVSTPITRVSSALFMIGPKLSEAPSRRLLYPMLRLIGNLSLLTRVPP